MTEAQESLPPRLQPALGTAGPSATRRSPRLLAALLIAVPVLALLYYHRPSGQFFFPRCSFFEATGLLCPGCGGLRASHDLLHLQWTSALRNNALLVLGPPALLAWVWARRSTRKPAVPGVREVWIAFALVLAFTVARNLPWPVAAWISP